MKSSIAAVMAHPDDAELWAGGTLAKHAALQTSHVIVETGDTVRIAEARQGARILGAEPHFAARFSRRWLIDQLHELCCGIVITHRLDDPHPDHARVGRLVTAAVQKAAIGVSRPIRLYTCDTYNSLCHHGLVPGRIIVDITESFEVKIAALGEHRSQPVDDFAAMVTRQAALWGARIGAKWGECFDPVPVLGRLPSTERL